MIFIDHDIDVTLCKTLRNGIYFFKISVVKIKECDEM